MSNQATVEKAVKEIVKNKLSIFTATPSPTDELVKLGIDSLDKLEIIMALEEEFGIDIPDGKAEAAQTVGHLIFIVEGLI